MIEGALLGGVGSLATGMLLGEAMADIEERHDNDDGRIISSLQRNGCDSVVSVSVRLLYTFVPNPAGNGCAVGTVPP